MNWYRALASDRATHKQHVMVGVVAESEDKARELLLTALKDDWYLLRPIHLMPVDAKGFPDLEAA